MAEQQRDKNYRKALESKVNTIDRLQDLNNTYRFLKRSTVVYENLGMQNQRQTELKQHKLKLMAQMAHELTEQSEVMAM
jgi:ABC-type Fe3+-citrate transport system substrate-binding protein